MIGVVSVMKINEIDEYIKSLSELDRNQLNIIEKGHSSYWKLIYGIDMDVSEERICFRADYNPDYFKCIYEQELKTMTEAIFYTRVKSGELEYKDLQSYDEIYNEIKKKEQCCIKCKSNHRAICVYQSNINKKIISREKYKFKITNSIVDISSKLLKEVRNAIENNNSIFRSYSKALAASLFKYGNKSSVLSINRLHTNTMKVDVIANCFKWYDEWDEFGNKKDRFPTFIEEKIIPLRCIGSRSAYLDEFISDIYSESEYLDIDSVELRVNGVTLDVSKFNRNKLNQFLGHTIYRYASFKKDLEVLTTEEPDYNISSSKCVQLIRFIYLLKISGCFEEKDYHFINDIYVGKYADIIVINSSDRCAFLLVWKYLLQDDKIRDERIQHYNLFKDNDKYKCLRLVSYTKQGVRMFFKSCLERYENGIFDEDFLRWLMENSSLGETALCTR